MTRKHLDFEKNPVHNYWKSCLFLISLTNLSFVQFWSIHCILLCQGECFCKFKFCLMLLLELRSPRCSQYKWATDVEPRVFHFLGFLLQIILCSFLSG
ncbi:hypothetical protein Peur_017886 [Populus x canadensis]